MQKSLHNYDAIVKGGTVFFFKENLYVCLHLMLQATVSNKWNQCRERRVTKSNAQCALLCAQQPEAMWWVSRKLGLQEGPTSPVAGLWAHSVCMNSTAERTPMLSGKPLPMTLGELKYFMHHSKLLFCQISLLLWLGCIHCAHKKVPNLISSLACEQMECFKR